MEASIVIAVYNKPHILRLILEAYGRQCRGAFEIIVADDGSGDDVAAVVRDARDKYSFPVQHLWHEDEGWRKNVMLNNAIRAAESGYMIFTDGDCLPHRLFVEDHLREREPGHYLCGRRVEMSARWSEKLTEASVRSGAFERIGVAEWRDGLTGHAQRIEDGLRFESRRIRNILHASPRGMLGSNFSVHREVLERINGFDEEYDGPGCGEDSDVQLRLDLAGWRCKSLRHLAIQYHVHHPRTTVPQRCLDRFERARLAQLPRCRKGLIHEAVNSDESIS